LDPDSGIRSPIAVSSYASLKDMIIEEIP
jgi:hypothetical protein